MHLCEIFIFLTLPTINFIPLHFMKFSKFSQFFGRIGGISRKYLSIIIWLFISVNHNRFWPKKCQNCIPLWINTDWIVTGFSRYSANAGWMKEWSTESMSFSITLYLFFSFPLCVRKAEHKSDCRGEYQCMWRCIFVSRANQKNPGSTSNSLSLLSHVFSL